MLNCQLSVAELSRMLCHASGTSLRGNVVTAEQLSSFHKLLKTLLFQRSLPEIVSKHFRVVRFLMFDTTVDLE